MENNQAHKIDKIFKNSLDNQLVTPPSDAWIAVHTYTIGQEEKKPKIWLRYAVLGLVVLLFSGLGAYYLNLDSPDLRISGLDSQRKIQKSINPVDLKISTIKSNKKIHKSINLQGATFRNPNSENLFSHEPTLLSHELLVENTNNGENTNNNRNEENAGRVLNPTSVENSVDSNDNTIPPTTEKQIENIEYKPLVLNDLSEKMKKESEKKIVILEEDIVDKEDSVVQETGKRFSLNHPIFSIGSGTSWNSWNMDDYYFNNFINATTKGAVIKVGVAWKLSKKVRLALGFKFNSLGNIDINHTIPPQSARLGSSTLTLTQINSDFFYTEITPFGNLNIPANLFKDWNINQPTQPSLISNVFYSSPHSITTFQGDVNVEYDLVSYKRKNNFSYQFYIIGGMNVQRQMNYNYSATNFFYGASSSFPPPTSFIPRVLFQDGHLQNGAEFVIGVNAGLGFRWQFAKKWSLYIETLGQTSLNSWVKNLPFTTKQTMYSLQGGIQLNL